MTSFKDILKMTVPKIPTEYQEEVMKDESYAYAGCVDMIMALGLDADVQIETSEEVDDEGNTVIVEIGYCTVDLSFKEKWLAALYTYKAYLERLKVSSTMEAINFKTLTFEIKGLEKIPENLNDSLYTLNRYLDQEIDKALGTSAIIGVVTSYGGEN